MSNKTKIEWCDKSWLPITGCTPVNVAFHPDRLDIPLHWRKPKKIFVCSTGDLFHEKVKPEWIIKILEVIRECPQHTFIILTKRPENVYRKLNKITWEYNRLNITWPNLWLGVTVENQDNDWRIKHLLQIPAARRFVSVEPMLGPVVFSDWGYDYLAGWNHEVTRDINGDPEPYQVQTEKIDWVICSPMNLDWARSLRDQCITANVPFFYKRGELDGKLWHQFPDEKV